MRDTIVSDDTMELAKKAGFDRDADLDEDVFITEIEQTEVQTTIKHPVTQSILQKWLRHRRVWVFVNPVHHPYMEKVEFKHTSSTMLFPTYEDALEDGLKWGLHLQIHRLQEDAVKRVLK